jgi:hypothetical protein
LSGCPTGEKIYLKTVLRYLNNKGADTPWLVNISRKALVPDTYMKYLYYDTRKRMEDGRAFEIEGT